MSRGPPVTRRGLLARRNEAPLCLDLSRSHQLYLTFSVPSAELTADKASAENATPLGT